MNFRFMQYFQLSDRLSSRFRSHNRASTESKSRTFLQTETTLPYGNFWVEKTGYVRTAGEMSGEQMYDSHFDDVPPPRGNVIKRTPNPTFSRAFYYISCVPIKYSNALTFIE